MVANLELLKDAGPLEGWDHRLGRVVVGRDGPAQGDPSPHVHVPQHDAGVRAADVVEEAVDAVGAPWRKSTSTSCPTRGRMIFPRPPV